MVGFMSGGKDGSLPFCKASRDTTTSFVYNNAEEISKMSMSGQRPPGGKGAYLLILQLESQCDFVAINALVDNLRCHPTLSGIGLPSSRTNIVAMRHGRLIVVCWARRKARIRYGVSQRIRMSGGLLGGGKS
jgi:hypothetical protein